MRSVFVIGSSMSRFGKIAESGRESLTKVCFDAIRDAGVEASEIDSTFYSNAFGLTERQAHVGPLINSALGIPGVPSVSVESACSSSSAALHEAFVHVASGLDDICLVAGSEKLSHLGTLSATTYFAMGSDFPFEAMSGVTFPGLYANIAVAHMKRYGTTQEMLASVAIKNHANAMHNPLAHFRKRISISDYMESPVIAYPFHLYDCCPFSDGSAAVVIASEEKARALKQELVEIAASERGGSVATLQDRADITSIDGAVAAARRAFSRSHIDPGDIDVAEVHDCFTIAEIIATEDIGLFPKGEGGRAAIEGETAIGGRVAVNPSGGLKAKGHPVSATGVAQIHELYEQLTGTAGGRQVGNAEIGIAHNVGATGGSCSVHILRRVR
ncbi:MAG: thiolase domain-containing protein [Thermoplasmata archaeon YP2-bin.285]|uniref:Thiolase domain-containing protein n=1 Tax=Candidatus Sysuiplasma superficiale TaxID=2823368 RepID=A0A8J7YST8_9ARCH|nr:thiolase domain-containing protein [Candidatus Sysuiplasma superficiale]